MSTFCERSDKSTNLKLSGKPNGRIIKPRRKTKYVSQNSKLIGWKSKKTKTSESDEK